MAAYSDIKVEIKDHIALISICRPKVLNALRDQTKEEIVNAVVELNDNPGIDGILITGEGKAFCAGSDISNITDTRTSEETIEMAKKGHYLMNTIENSGKPVIAVINGYALGGGLELALACDMRVISSSAKVGVPEVALGVAPCYGGTVRLTRLIGSSRAKYLLFTGRKVAAEEAYSLGIADRVFAPEELIEKSFDLMNQISANSPTAVSYCKKIVDKAGLISYPDALEYEIEIAGFLAETDDAREGMKAFQEKRPPRFHRIQEEEK